jgi:hypothetical protein
MDRAYFHGLMVKNTKVTLSMISAMETEFSDGKTEKSIMDSGRMENNTV